MARSPVGPPQQAPMGAHAQTHAHAQAHAHGYSPRSQWSNNTSHQSSILEDEGIAAEMDSAHGGIAHAHGMAALVDSISTGQREAEEEEEEKPAMKYRIPLLGANNTGKTALVSQFLTSEYMNTYDASLGMH